MASLLTGTPGSSTSTVSQQTPPWMQDAIFNTITWAQNLANKPYAAYEQARIAGFTPTEQAGMRSAIAEAGSYAPYLGAAGETLGRAGRTTGMGGAEGALGRAELMSSAAAAKPFLTQGMGAIQAGGMGSAAAAASPFIGQAVGQSPLVAAQPYLSQAGQTFPGAVESYMSPYTKGVVNQIADLGVRQLQERFLPAVGEEFIRAGQFGPGPGSSRMREFGARALRDVQEAVLAEQQKALESGYKTAADIFASDVGRQAQLAGTAGTLGTAQQRALLEAGQTTGQLSQADLSRLLESGATVADIGKAYGAATAADAQRLAEIGATRGRLSAEDAANLRAIAQQYGGLGEAAQTLGLRGAAAVTGVGQAERDMAQRALDLAYQQYQEETEYPYKQLGFQAGIIGGFPSGSTGVTRTESTIDRAAEPSDLAKILGALSGATALYKAWKGP